mmetsp:Transcript_15691/g.23557  ORF Transcript_15691/g.23557 Transcript_15691/m.23557 type:complete len:99 (+) Transcript_15691:1382-1678(+)
MVKDGVTQEITMITPITLENVARYDLIVATSFSSTVKTSLLNLFIILPVGVVSKKDIGARSTTSSNSVNRIRLARRPEKRIKISLQNIVSTCVRLMSA